MSELVFNDKNMIQTYLTNDRNKRFNLSTFLCNFNNILPLRASDSQMLESVVGAANEIGVTFFAVAVGPNIDQAEIEVN